MPKPTKLPRWATTGSVTEPTEAKKDSGWLAAEKPPAQFFNWLFNIINQWCVYLDAFESEVHTFSARQEFNRTIAPSVASSDNSAVEATLTSTGTVDSYAVWAQGLSGRAGGIYAQGANAVAGGSGHNALPGGKFTGGQGVTGRTTGFGIVAEGGQSNGGARAAALSASGLGGGSTPNHGITCLGGTLSSSATSGSTAGTGIVVYGGASTAAGLNAGPAIVAYSGDAFLGGSGAEAAIIANSGHATTPAISARNLAATNVIVIDSDGFIGLHGSHQTIPSNNQINDVITVRNTNALNALIDPATLTATGFGVASVSIVSNSVRVSFVGVQPDTLYNVTVTGENTVGTVGAYLYSVTGGATGYVGIGVYNTFTNSAVAISPGSTANVKFSIQVFGNRVASIVI